MVTKKKETTGHLLVQSAYTSEEFIVRLTQLGVKSAIDNSRYFRGDDRKNKFLGVQMSAIFSLAKQFTQMLLPEVKQLLASNFYEARMGAVSIMDFQARDRKITADRRKELYSIYMKHHDRINNWDLVDRSAPYVVGGYLFDRSRAPLYKLAKSKNVWERRTAIVSTYYFIRQNDLAATFKIAALLIHDKHDLINKAVGSWVREAGKRDQQQLIHFLDKYAATMPRVTLRYAIEKLDKRLKQFYLKLTK